MRATFGAAEPAAVDRDHARCCLSGACAASSAGALADDGKARDARRAGLREPTSARPGYAPSRTQTTAAEVTPTGQRTQNIRVMRHSDYSASLPNRSAGADGPGGMRATFGAAEPAAADRDHARCCLSGACAASSAGALADDGKARGARRAGSGSRHPPGPAAPSQGPRPRRRKSRRQGSERRTSA